jgi:hypothetical protein
MAMKHQNGATVVQACHSSILENQEFQVNLGYTARPYLKKQTKTKNEITHFKIPLHVKQPHYKNTVI